MGTREKDELIIAKILSVPHTLNQRIASGNGFNADITDLRDGPSCAVGAGVLYTGLTHTSVSDPLTLFAKAHRVPVVYAAGVSDGFEADADGVVRCQQLGHGRDLLNKHYQRGYAVGAAVRLAVKESK